VTDGHADRRDRAFGCELGDHPRDDGPQVGVLMSVHVGDRQPDADDALELRGELATDVVRVDAPRDAPRDDGPVGARELAARVDQRGHLARGEKRRVLADEREVRPEVERRGVAEHRGRSVERTADGEQRRRRHDPVEMRPVHGTAHAIGQAEVVGGHDEQTAHV
jgi:hypothetical protein